MAPASPTFVDLMHRFAAQPAPAPDERDPGFVELGPRFDEALLYAAAAHRQQPRKGTAAPYLSQLRQAPQRRGDPGRPRGVRPAAVGAVPGQDP